MRRVWWSLLLSVGILSVALVGCFHSQAKVPTYVLRYAENQAFDYPTTQGGIYFAQLVEERTNGDIKIHMHYGEELGEESSVLQQVHFGGIDFARISTAQIVPYSEKHAVLILPYLYRDNEHLWSVLDGEIGDSFLGEIGDSGLFGLSWYDAGARHFYTSAKQLTCLEDLQGLKIRVQVSPYMEDVIRALGADPVTIPYSLVYSNLSTGAVDGAENNWPSYESMKHYQVAPYILLDGHVRIPEMQLMSAKTAAMLPKEYLQIIQECAKESAEYERWLWAERETASRKIAEDAGVVIMNLSEKERLKFQQACEPVYEKYAGDYRDIVQEILNTK